MLERDAKESGTRQRILDEVKRTRKADERAHERMEEDRRRMLRDLERQERIAWEQEEDETYARKMRVRDESERKALKREEESYLRGLDNQAREARKKEARDYRPSRDSRRSLPATGRRVSDAGYRPKQWGRHNTYDGDLTRWDQIIGVDPEMDRHGARSLSVPKRSKEATTNELLLHHGSQRAQIVRQSIPKHRRRPRRPTGKFQTVGSNHALRKLSHHILQDRLPKLLRKQDRLGASSGRSSHRHRVRYVTRLESP